MLALAEGGKNQYSRKQLERQGSMHWVHWLIVALSLVLTFFAWYFTQQQVNEKRRLQFQRESDQLIELVQERMMSYEDALWSGVALIQSEGGEIGYAQWKRYVDSLNILKKYPGINGLGVIYQVKPAELASYLEKQRRLRPDFTIHPKHMEKVYLPITYIIPVKGNEKAVGLDMAHEKNRFTAALKAEDTGKAQITGPIVLVQDQERTPGFLFYAPYYLGGTYQNESERRANFVGMVYAPFIFKKLMGGVLAKQNRHVAFKISDGDDVLYDELHKGNQFYDSESAYHFMKEVPVYGRIWKFEITGSKVFSTTITDTQPLTILIGGIIIDSLLLTLFILISRSNRRALAYADNMTKALEERSESLELSNRQLVRLKGKLEKMAHFDLLTGLPNRHSFLEYLKKSIARADRNNKLLAVCFIDLDNFKIVNDTMGHAIGDKLLEHIPRVLLPLLRDIDYMGRLSGDEFGLIIENVDSPVEVDKYISTFLKAFNTNMRIQGYEVNMTASVGIAMYPAAGKESDTLLKHADIAMYKAKESGKNTWSFFSEEINKKVQRRHLLERELSQALKSNEFYLVYQPQYAASTDSIFGVESLLRWRNKTLGDVSPAEFIPVAEEVGLINDIGTWVFRQVIKDYPVLRKISQAMMVSVNVSMWQLERALFDKEVLSLFQNSHLPLSRLILEVTETAVMRNPEKVVEVMARLSRAGMSFALDDFGVGQSAMSYLKGLPIRYIKIDQSFVQDIEEDSSDAAIVNAIIQLSTSLGCDVIAEGVETQGQLEYLKSHQCSHVQGFYLAKPMTLDQLSSQHQSF